MPALADISPLWKGLCLITKKFDLTYTTPQIPFSRQDAVRPSTHNPRFFNIYCSPR